MIEVLAIMCASIGVAFMSIAVLGIIRLPDFYTRMQATSKASSLGTILVMTAVAAHFATPLAIMKATGFIAFIFLTTPLSAHLLIRGAYWSGVKKSKITKIDELQNYPLETDELA